MPIGYGFLIPVFLVTSGLTFNLSVLFSSASILLRVPLFVLALLVVRGLPAVLCRSALASIRDVAAAGLLQATSLPFIVAATTIGLQLHAIRPANAAAVVAAGLFQRHHFPRHLAAVAAIVSPRATGTTVRGYAAAA
ncbi:MAG TPA: cation:proton antiporter [Streptosporangiaceae bacterium]